MLDPALCAVLLAGSDVAAVGEPADLSGAGFELTAALAGAFVFEAAQDCGAADCGADVAAGWLAGGASMFVCRMSEKLGADELAEAELEVGAGLGLGPCIISRIASVMNRAACA